jgi:hypothetical protein
MGLTKPTFNKKIVWNQLNETTLRAEPEEHPNWSYGLSEADLDPIQAWCVEHHCGKRTSFDMFKFTDEAEITLFLLKWG